MKKRLFSFLKNALLTIFILASLIVCFGLWQGASLHYGDNPEALNWEKEGPYIFYQNDSSLSINYIHGNQDDGLYTSQREFGIATPMFAECYFPLDESSFQFEVTTDFVPPQSSYDDGEPILAISDIESGYKGFRDFLIAHQVLDQQLNWTFGKGHLVLVGDFVDRGFSATQVLWLIFKLEQEAVKHGGTVHFIIGNHELKNLQGDYQSASPKYFHIASVLGKLQTELYDLNSLMGRWLSSKNAIEKINDILFVHGGIHPEIADLFFSLEEINQIIRDHYYLPYYPQPEQSPTQFLISNKTGPCWYRGYFKDDLSQAEVERGLDFFQAKSVVVGHTLQAHVNRQYEGKVIAIDVHHPKDYHKNWPSPHAEALLIEAGKYYRLSADGEREEI